MAQSVPPDLLVQFYQKSPDDIGISDWSVAGNWRGICATIVEELKAGHGRIGDADVPQRARLIDRHTRTVYATLSIDESGVVVLMSGEHFE